MSATPSKRRSSVTPPNEARRPGRSRPVDEADESRRLLPAPALALALRIPLAQLHRRLLYGEWPGVQYAGEWWGELPTIRTYLDRWRAARQEVVGATILGRHKEFPRWKPTTIDSIAAHVAALPFDLVSQWGAEVALRINYVAFEQRLADGQIPHYVCEGLRFFNVAEIRAARAAQVASSWTKRHGPRALPPVECWVEGTPIRPPLAVGHATEEPVADSTHTPAAGVATHTDHQPDVQPGDPTAPSSAQEPTQ